MKDRRTLPSRWNFLKLRMRERLLQILSASMLVIATLAAPGRALAFVRLFTTWCQAVEGEKLDNPELLSSFKQVE